MQRSGGLVVDRRMRHLKVANIIIRRLGKDVRSFEAEVYREMSEVEQHRHQVWKKASDNIPQ